MEKKKIGERKKKERKKEKKALNSIGSFVIHMAQKRDNINLDIIHLLLKQEHHVREIAKILNEPHATVSRKLMKLIKENVVDFRKEGKNKVYFLKKTPEAKGFIFMAESYNLIKVLRKYSFLRRIINRIQNDKEIKIAIIFGSYAKARAKKDSDIDVYIETTDKKIKQDLELFDSKISVKIGKYDKKNLLIKEIEKNHIIIKGVERYYEKSGFFD